MENDDRFERIGKLLEKLRGGWIVVEGKRDKEALIGLGFTKVLTASGNLRQSCERLAALGACRVFVLTDLDRRGDELAMRARDELEGLSMSADLGMRKDLARLLHIRNFEDAKRAFERIREEAETGKMIRNEKKVKTWQKHT